jgi:hypothetical protein
MLASELIVELQEAIERHGDLECFSSHVYADPKVHLRGSAYFPADFDMPAFCFIIGDET